LNNSNELLLNPVSTDDAGSYTVTVDDNGCTANSAALNLEVYEKPTVTIDPKAAMEIILMHGRDQTVLPLQ